MGKRHAWGIWLFAFGYFLSYVPYSAVAKGASSGLLPGLAEPVSGLAMLPVVATTALVALLIAITGFSWWGTLERRRVLGVSIPFPQSLTFASGIATGVTGIATTLAYTLDGVSIVFMMLLMRGGVLAMAPLIDLLTKRRIRWYSMLALVLCLGALVVAFLGRRGFDVTVIALVDVGVYLAAYFFRLQWMSRAGKIDDPKVQRRYFVEEQLVSSVLICLALGGAAVFGQDEVSLRLREGFGYFEWSPRFFYLAIIGLAAQGAGIFGALVLLDPRENAFAVPVNRASSIAAGLTATVALAFFFGTRDPSIFEQVGSVFIIGAIAALTVPPALVRAAVAKSRVPR